ncbi:MAG: hypothetical protein V7605_2536 [Acidimicrobiaceae bacterium]
MSSHHPGQEPLVEIREVGPQEFDELGRLTVEAYSGLAGFEPGDGYLAELGDVARRAALAVVLVAVDGHGGVLGGVTYVPGPGPYFDWEGHDAGRPTSDDAGIRMLAVAPEARGAGVGTALVRACLARARADGRVRVWLHTTPGMTQAHRIYEREGFVRAPAADWRGSIRLWAYVLDL